MNWLNEILSKNWLLILLLCICQAAIFVIPVIVKGDIYDRRHNNIIRRFKWIIIVLLGFIFSAGIIYRQSINSDLSTKKLEKQIASQNRSISYYRSNSQSITVVAKEFKKKPGQPLMSMNGEYPFLRDSLNTPKKMIEIPFANIGDDLAYDFNLKFWLLSKRELGPILLQCHSYYEAMNPIGFEKTNSATCEIETHHPFTSKDSVFIIVQYSYKNRKLKPAPLTRYYFVLSNDKMNFSLLSKTYSKRFSSLEKEYVLY